MPSKGAAKAAAKGGGKGHNFKSQRHLATDDGVHFTLFGCADDGCGERRVLKGGKGAKGGKGGRK